MTPSHSNIFMIACDHTIAIAWRHSQMMPKQDSDAHARRSTVVACKPTTPFAAVLKLSFTWRWHRDDTAISRPQCELDAENRHAAKNKQKIHM